MEEFDGMRAKLYKEAMKEFPDAREEDIKLMKNYLAPQKGETILEVGAGSGFFSKYISEIIGNEGRLIVSDPSVDQLEEVKELKKENIKIIQFFENKKNLKVDAIWSFGAMHHNFQKKKDFENFKRILKENGRIIIGDVFADSKLAKHFDDKVDKYCITGHKVEFWTDKMVEDICKEIGFDNFKIESVNIKWKFNSKKDIGLFLYKLHAMTKTTPEEVLKGAEDILGIEENNGKFYLNWPMKFIVIN